MHSVNFLEDLAVVMLVAGLVTVLFHRLKQPVVLGYIVAGVIIGPHTPPAALIHDQETKPCRLRDLGINLIDNPCHPGTLLILENKATWLKKTIIW